MRTVMVMLLTGSALLALHPASRAQARAMPPTIVRFASDVAFVRLAEIEATGVSASLEWYVAYYADSYHLELDSFRLNGWESLLDEGETLPAAGSRRITITHPLNFGPPTYRLRVVAQDGGIADERTLTIPYEPQAGFWPEIAVFATSVPDVDAAALAAGTARIPVSWQVEHRQPQTHLVFEQILPDNSAVTVDLPRDHMWVSSAGEGVVAPVPVPGEAQVWLRLSVIDPVSQAVYTQADLIVPIRGAVPAIRTPTPTPRPIATAVPAALPEGDCSENPYYAEATVALEWLAQHPPSTSYASQYGHAQLDALYAQLLAEGMVGPPPPPCKLVAISETTVYSSPSLYSDRVGDLRPGVMTDVSGRNADSNWWYIRLDQGRGWVSASSTVLQPGADVDAIPVTE
jgi:hypothetical protein